VNLYPVNKQSNGYSTETYILIRSKSEDPEKKRPDERAKRNTVIFISIREFSADRKYTRGPVGIPVTLVARFPCDCFVLAEVLKRAR